MKCAIVSIFRAGLKVQEAEILTEKVQLLFNVKISDSFSFSSKRN